MRAIARKARTKNGLKDAALESFKKDMIAHDCFRIKLVATNDVILRFYRKNRFLAKNTNRIPTGGLYFALNSPGEKTI
jgi:hypothetical protein